MDVKFRGLLKIKNFLGLRLFGLQFILLFLKRKLNLVIKIIYIRKNYIFTFYNYI